MERENSIKVIHAHPIRRVMNLLHKMHFLIYAYSRIIFDYISQLCVLCHVQKSTFSALSYMCRSSNELLHVDVKMRPSCLTHSTAICIIFDTLYCRQTTKHQFQLFDFNLVAKSLYCYLQDDIMTILAKYSLFFIFVCESGCRQVELGFSAVDTAGFFGLCKAVWSLSSFKR